MQSSQKREILVFLKKKNHLKKNLFGQSNLKRLKYLAKKSFRRQDKGNVWFIICDQVTTLCLQLDGSYNFFFLNSLINSDSLNRPPNTNLINVHW